MVPPKEKSQEKREKTMNKYSEEGSINKEHKVLNTFLTQKVVPWYEEMVERRKIKERRKEKVNKVKGVLTS